MRSFVESVESEVPRSLFSSLVTRCIDRYVGVCISRHHTLLVARRRAAGEEPGLFGAPEDGGGQPEKDE